MCRACTFLTRETGKGESEIALCAACYDGKPGDKAMVASGQMTQEEFDVKWAEPAECVSPRQGDPFEGFDSEPVKRQPKAAPQVRVIECGDCEQVIAEYEEGQPRPDVPHTCVRQVLRNRKAA